MSDPTRTPVQYAGASGSWRTDSPLPEAPEARLTVPLPSLRALSGVHRQAWAFPHRQRPGPCADPGAWRAGQGGYGLCVIADLTGVHHEPDRTLVWACITEPA